MSDHRLFPQVISNERQNKARVILTRLINARYSVPTWLWASSSLLSAVLVVMITLSDPVKAAPFLNAVFLGQFWAPLTAAGSLVAMYGMAKLQFRVVRWTSFVLFCLWVFGAFAFTISGAGVIIFYFVGQIIIFWGYKYLASFIRITDRV